MTKQVFKSRFGIRADFDVDARKLDADGNVLSSRRILTKCPNLITDTGMDAFNSYTLQELMGALHVGTDGTAPAFTDTVLGNKRAAVGAGGSGDNTLAWDVTNPKTLVYKRVFTFAVGAASGALRELGFSNATNGNIFTHALFKDAFGDPTIVDVDSDEQLLVTYRLYIIPDERDSMLVKVQGGTEYTIVFRFALLGVVAGSVAAASRLCVIGWPGQSYSYDVSCYYGPSSAIGPVTGGPTGTEIGNSLPFTLGAYTTGNYYRDDSVTVPLDLFNVNELGAIQLRYANPFKTQIGISPRLNKTSNDTIKFTVRTRWYRA